MAADLLITVFFVAVLVPDLVALSELRLFGRNEFVSGGVAGTLALGFLGNLFRALVDTRFL